MTRDIDKEPYTESEQRVANWLAKKTGAGGGDDPIGFLIASHEMVVSQRNALVKLLEDIHKQGQKVKREMGIV
jgi:mevalonate kinase